jgi:cellulose biosynthesis protein BcsQ
MMSNKIITYVFTLPCGGVGKTTMSVACAKAHALQGRLGNKDFEFWEECV